MKNIEKTQYIYNTGKFIKSSLQQYTDGNLKRQAEALKIMESYKANKDPGSLAFRIV